MRERLGELTLIDQYSLNLPDGTPIPFRIIGNVDELVANGFELYRHTPESLALTQQWFTDTAVNSQTQLYMMSINYEEWTGGGNADGRPDAQGNRDGERVIQVDLSQGVDVLLVPDQSDFPEMIAWSSHQLPDGSFKPHLGYFIDSVGEEQLVTLVNTSAPE